MMKRFRRYNRKQIISTILILLVVLFFGGKDKFYEIFPSLSYEETPQTVSTTELEAVTLVRVVDGDTIVISKDGKEEKVRFLEVNTPESVHSDESKNNTYGDMASDYTKTKLSYIHFYITSFKDSFISLYYFCSYTLFLLLYSI